MLCRVTLFTALIAAAACQGLILAQDACDSDAKCEPNDICYEGACVPQASVVKLVSADGQVYSVVGLPLGLTSQTKPLQIDYEFRDDKPQRRGDIERSVGSSDRVFYGPEPAPDVISTVVASVATIFPATAPIGGAELERKLQDLGASAIEAARFVAKFDLIKTDFLGGTVKYTYEFRSCQKVFGKRYCSPWAFKNQQYQYWIGARPK